MAATANAGDADLLRGHSHNDYEQRHPLQDALDQRIHSVEADIWFRHGKILVSHGSLHFKGTLDELYLDPLQKLADRQGSVFGDGKPFFLWLDIKDRSPALREALRRMLDRYPMLTLFDGAHSVAGAVTVVLTGDQGSKAAFVEVPGPRRACRDSNEFSAGDPAADDRWSWYALQWTRFTRWRGLGPIPAADHRRLLETVRVAHAKGRQVRFWDIPANEAAWQEAFADGVDLIGADDLSRLNRFLTGQPSKGL